MRLPAPLGGAQADAGPRWYRIKARPLETETRRRALWAWIVADISRERARQETVFQELQHAIDYLDHAPAGFLSAEPDGRIVYLNATLAEWLGIDLTGFVPGELRLEDIVHGEAIALLSAPVDGEVLSRTAIIDLDLVKRNGQSLPVRLLHRVPVTADGAPGATRTLVLNRSPGEDASEALRAAEVRFTRFFNNTPMAMAALDSRGRIGRSNAAFARMFGAPRTETGAKRLVDLVRESDRPQLEAALRMAEEGASNIPSIDAIRAPRGRAHRAHLCPARGRRRRPQRGGDHQRARRDRAARARGSSSRRARRCRRSANSPAASPTTSTTC